MTQLERGGRRFRVSNLDKVLWPDAPFTKGEMLEYYERVAPVLLPHVECRPLTLRRFPDGVDGGNWYQIQWPKGAPDWLPTAELPAAGGGVWRYCVVDDVASLLWAANLAAIELHPFLARADALEQPTALVFDLDPGPPADVRDCCAVALRLRELVPLESFPKTSGSVGLHVYVPLNTPVTYEETKAYARQVAAQLAAEAPDRITDRASRSERAGKVFVDWLQNDATRSTVAPYSLRGTAWPTVSTPLDWLEVERVVVEQRPYALTFDARTILDRLGSLGDLFAPVLELRQRLRFQ